MRRAICKLRSMAGSPYSASRPLADENAKKAKSESWDDFEARIWRERAYVDEKTREIYVPGEQFRFALAAAAQRLGEKIEGRGNKTWTDFFGSGVMVENDLLMGTKIDDCKSASFYCHANGKRMPGTRVYRRFPMVAQWSGTLRFVLIDDTIPEDKFEEYLRYAGKMIGIGRYRPQNRGVNGRFLIESIKWESALG